MPGTQPPAMGASGPWDWVRQMFNSITRRLHALENQQTMIVLDQYQNAVSVIGQLNQTVTEGASYGVPGSSVSTGLTGAGVASVTGLFLGNGGATVFARIWGGSGVPSSTLGANGDFYFRSGGTHGTTTLIYHKETGSWVGII